jgi:hypothetical protein
MERHPAANQTDARVVAETGKPNDVYGKLSADVQAFIKRLEMLGVTFHVSHPAPGGSRTLEIPADDLALFERDPIEYFAKRHRVTKEQYIAWHATEYSVQCSGTNKRGQRCKHIVKGGLSLDIERWVELQGSYCEIHATYLARTASGDTPETCRPSGI